MPQGLVVIAHGTVDSLDDIPAFLTNIRRGHAPPQELVDEVTRRYRAIGGKSPLNDTTRAVAEKLAAATGLPARACGRLFAPYPREAIDELFALGVDELVVVPLAQHSAPLYVDAVRAAVRESSKPETPVVGPANYGREPRLVRVFADRVERALREIPADELATTSVVFTAHSLPVAVVRAGDPYEAEFRASVELVDAAVGVRPGMTSVCFQSQGMSQGPGGRPVEWMGPDLRKALEHEKARGAKRVVIAPIGFLADHVEILYDLDIEARAWAEELGLAASRTVSLNADDAFIDALVAVITPYLALPRTSTDQAPGPA
ncbi:MAG: ferrochelatase [Polyangiaceae bacterium]